MPDQDRNAPADVKAKVKSAAGDMAQSVKSRATEAVDTLSSETANYATEAKDAVADEVKSVASALRSAADDMRSGSAAERTFSQIADGLADASETMHDKDLGQIVGVLTDFAKRNPVVFLGGAMLLGFAATRFAKASGDAANPSTSRSGPGAATSRSTTPVRSSYGTPDRDMVRPTATGREQG